jgi:Fe-S-cluster-containing dehydrogenase component
MHILGSSELVEDVHKKDLCVDCGACVGLCPYFVSHNGKIARLFPCTLPQGRCYAHCPKTQVDLSALSTWLFGKTYDMSALGHFKDILLQFPFWLIRKMRPSPVPGPNTWHRPPSLLSQKKPQIPL